MGIDHVSALLIEDNPGDARLFEEILLEITGFDCDFEWVKYLSAGIERLKSGGIDVVVLDLSLPDSHGFDSFQRIHESAPQVPIVLLTGLDDDELGTRAVREGAQDYLVKGKLEANLLVRSLRYAIERKRFANALHQSELLFEKMFNNLLDAVFVIDTDDDKIINCNPAVTAVFGYSPEELLGHSSQDIVCPDNWKKDDLPCSVCMSGSPPGGVLENHLTRKDGSSFFAEISCVQIKDDISQTDTRVVIVRDISERKNAEENLRESQERYELAVCGANDGLWDWDIKANQVYYSPRWKSMLGYEEEEIGSSPDEWFGRIHPEECESFQIALNGHLRGHVPHFELEHRIQHRDGGYRWVLTRGLAVLDANGVAYRMAGSQTDISIRKGIEAQLIHDAFHDHLTGLPNRALFIDRLGHTIEHNRRRDDYQYAVLFLDLDRFKIINDSLGHSVGDRLLVEIAHVLQKCLRAGDTLARIGGDEFVILLEDIFDVQDAVHIAQRIQKILSQPFKIDHNLVYTTASIGIVLSNIGYKTHEDILRDADIAMYQAKLMGKAQYMVFDTDMRSRAISRLELENDMRYALKHGEFELHYQPIVYLKDRLIIGFEALLRWQHPERGYILPMEFIPIAEETGLIFEIGGWILREACSQMQHWQQGFPNCLPLGINVNISQLQFSQSEMVKLVHNMLEETGLNPGSLNLEITENMLMEHADEMIVRLGQLRDLGVGLQIDDFGTGYSSLSYLQRFPIDTLKIDHSFISRIGTNGERAEIINTILILARELGIRAIAEGVETKNQMDRLIALGCEYGQGYYLGRPIKARQVTGLLRSNIGQPVLYSSTDEAEPLDMDLSKGKKLHFSLEALTKIQTDMKE